MAVMPPEEVSGRPKRETIEELFSALESPLLGYARRLTGDFTVAEDMVQEAFMKLHGQFDDVREPRRWLYRTVHNMSLNHLRNTAKIVHLEAPSNRAEAQPADPADPQPLPDEEIARIEGIGQVRLTLEALDARSQELVRLKFTEGLSYKEMSERTGLKIGHVGYLLHHALKAVAEQLARNGIVP
jgi:RNA polymerase sigma factor (sigma-70 family)